MKNLTDIFRTLELNEGNGLYLMSEDIWKTDCHFSNRVARLIENKISPDAFFCFDNKPLILFYDSPTDKNKIHRAIWNFNESPIVIIANNNEVEIFNGFSYLKDNNSLELIGGKNRLSDFDYFQLVTGKTWEKYKEQLNYTNRVDYKLLNNIKIARNQLKSYIVKSFGIDELSAIANALIGKVIFVRYLIDRKVRICFENQPKFWTNDDFCKLLTDIDKTIQFFKYFEEKFNGDMFPLKNADYNKLSQKSLNVIIDLLSENDLESGQQSLFKLYDFSIIPIEFVSNVYEFFIGGENQEKDGAYYTPLFLVDYILKETVDKKFSENKEFYNCKVFDPACGSGIFLVESLRKIIDQYLINYPNAKEEPENFKETLQNLAKNNIYGIDKNLSAIQVAIFSIYLTLLDYQEPSDIETFKFPKLLNNNFFEIDFFKFEDNCFKEHLNHIEFDFILGNPPWKRGEKDKESLFLEYIKYRKKNEANSQTTEITISNKEIAQAFLLRVSDFSVKHFCALIVTSKILYNLNAKDFRKYFLHNFFIHKVFELAPVRHEVFDKSNDPSVAPAAILFYNYAQEKNTDKNIIEHIALKPSRFFSLFKVFSLSRNDYKQVEQQKLKEYDWLWKILVYGSYLDFNFINRLKNNYSSIEKEIECSDRFIKGVGITINGGDENDISHLIGFDYINTRKKNIRPFWINTQLDKWNISVVHRPRNSILYQTPMLLVSNGISNKFNFTGAAICFKNAVFTDSLTAIKALKKDDVNSLRVILAILNSSFFSYYALEVCSSIGIEREKVHAEEKWTVPYCYNENIAKAVEELEFILSNTSGVFNQIANEKKSELEEKVYQLFDLSDSEKSLLDYANSIVIPIQKKHKGHEELFNPIEFRSLYLEDYAKLYLNRFKPSLDSEEQRFVVEILHTNQLIGMRFKIISISEYKEDIIWNNNKSNINIISLCISLSSEKITDKLFIQKDIRGFEKDYFYIFKPNEKRLWHKAIGYLDVNEFMDAILKIDETQGE